MKNTIMVASLVSLLCFTLSCRSKAERAELEEQNVEKLAHGHETDLLKAPAIRQDEMTHPEEENENLLQPPDKIMDAIGLKPGMIIGEVGAGFGRFTVWLARRVGNKGVVYANDIDEGALEFLERRSKQGGLDNIKIVLGQTHDPCFPPPVS